MGTETRVKYLILQPLHAYYALVDVMYPKPYPETQTRYFHPSAFTMDERTYNWDVLDDARMS